MTTYRTVSRFAVGAGLTAGGLLFVAAGAGKLVAPGAAAEAHRLGVPDDVRLWVGAVEVVGGLLVLWPRTWVAGVAALAGVLAAAVASRLANGRPDLDPGFLLPVALVAAVAAAARGRDRIAWRERYAAVLARYAARGERR